MSEPTGGGGEKAQFLAEENFSLVFDQIGRAFISGEETIGGSVGRLNAALARLGGIDPTAVTANLHALEIGADRIQAKMQEHLAAQMRTVSGGIAPSTSLPQAAKQGITQVITTTSKDLRAAGVEEGQIKAIATALGSLATGAQRLAQAELSRSAAEKNVTLRPSRNLQVESVVPRDLRADGDYAGAMAALNSAITGRTKAAERATIAEEESTNATRAATSATRKAAETPAAKNPTATSNPEAQAAVDAEILALKKEYANAIRRAGRAVDKAERLATPTDPASTTRAAEVTTRAIASTERVIAAADAYASGLRALRPQGGRVAAALGHVDEVRNSYAATREELRQQLPAFTTDELQAGRNRVERQYRRGLITADERDAELQQVERNVARPLPPTQEQVDPSGERQTAVNAEILTDLQRTARAATNEAGAAEASAHAASQRATAEEAALERFRVEQGREPRTRGGEITKKDQALLAGYSQPAPSTPSTPSTHQDYKSSADYTNNADFHPAEPTPTPARSLTKKELEASQQAEGERLAAESRASHQQVGNITQSDVLARLTATATDRLAASLQAVASGKPDLGSFKQFPELHDLFGVTPREVTHGALPDYLPIDRKALTDVEHPATSRGRDGTISTDADDAQRIMNRSKGELAAIEKDLVAQKAATGLSAREAAGVAEEQGKVHAALQGATRTPATPSQQARAAEPAPGGAEAAATDDAELSAAKRRLTRALREATEATQKALNLPTPATAQERGRQAKLLDQAAKAHVEVTDAASAVGSVVSRQHTGTATDLAAKTRAVDQTFDESRQIAANLRAAADDLRAGRSAATAVADAETAKATAAQEGVAAEKDVTDALHREARAANDAAEATRVRAEAIPGQPTVAPTPPTAPVAPVVVPVEAPSAAAAGGGVRPPTGPPAPPAATPEPPEKPEPTPPHVPIVRTGAGNQELSEIQARRLAEFLHSQVEVDRLREERGLEPITGVRRVKSGFVQDAPDGFTDRTYFKPGDHGGVEQLRGDPAQDKAQTKMYGDYEAADNAAAAARREAKERNRVADEERQNADLLAQLARETGTNIHRTTKGFIDTTVPTEPEFHTLAGRKLEPSSKQAIDIADTHEANQRTLREAGEARDRANAVLTEALPRAQAKTAAAVGPNAGIFQVGANTYVDKTGAMPEYYKTTTRGGQTQARLLDPAPDKDAGTIRGIEQEHAGQQKAAFAQAETDAAKDHAAREEVIAAERKLHSEISALALEYGKRAAAEAAQRDAPPIAPVKGGFVDTRSGEAFAQTRPGQARRLDPLIEADAELIASMKAEQLANQEAAREALRVAAAQKDVQRTTERINSLTAEANLIYTRALIHAAEDVRQRAGFGLDSTGPIRKVSEKTFAIDGQNGAPKTFVDVDTRGHSTQIGPDHPLYDRYDQTDKNQQAAARFTRETQETTKRRRDEGEASREAAAADRQLAKAALEQSRKGLFNNFLAGVSNAGMGGSGGFSGSFDGLAKTAGTTLKYSAMYQIMGLLQQAASQVVTEFLDVNDSITELNIAMGEGTQVTADFTNSLADSAALGGFNVGESMDVAARGIRAFGEQVQDTQGGTDELGESFARTASRIAVLTKGTLTASADQLVAIVNGAGLAPTATGFTQVADVISGAKKQGGGAETEIAQGLAGSSVILTQMGFSLTEQALIISKLNADTAESGTQLASRVARLASLFGGTGGKTFLRGVNTTLTTDQKQSLTDQTGSDAIDLTSNVADQIKGLAAVWDGLSATVQSKAVNTLGGGQSPREFISLMKEIGGITKTAGNQDLFVGASTKEFEERLKNVRAELNNIKGNVKDIITSLSQAGLAAPFVSAVGFVKLLSTGVADLSQSILKAAEFLGKIKINSGVLVDIGAILLAVKALGAIRAAGGIGAALQAQEARYMPGRALARRNLKAEDEDAAAANPSAAPRPGKDRVIYDRQAEAATARVERASKQVAGVAADEVVHKAAGDLRAARDELDKRILAHSQDGSVENAGHVQQARVGVASATAGLNEAERRQGVEGGVATRFDSARDTSIEKFTNRLAGHDEDISRRSQAVAEDDSPRNRARRQAALNARLVTEQEFTARLRAIEVQRLAAERAGAIAAGRSAGFNRLDSFTGGSLGRLRTGYGEGGLRGLGRASWGELRTGGAALARGAYDMAGGALGIGTIAVATTAAVAGAIKEAQKAQDESTRVMLLPVAATAAGLEAASQANATAAASLQDASESMWGWPERIKEGIFRGFGGVGQSDKEQADSQKQLAGIQHNQGLAVAKFQKEQGARATNTNDLLGGIDFTDASSITASLSNLDLEGQSAAKQMAALGAEIRNIGNAATDSTGQLSSLDKKNLAIGVGNKAFLDQPTQVATIETDINNLPKFGGRHGKHRLTDEEKKKRADDLAALNARKDALEAVGQDGLRTTTESTVQDFLNAGGEVKTKEGQGRLRALLKRQYENIGLKPEDVAALANDAVMNTIAGWNTDMKGLIDPELIKNAITASLAKAQQVGQEAAALTQYDQLSSGQVDTSASTGTKATLDSLVAKRAEAKTSMDASVKLGVDKGGITQQEEDDQLERLDKGIRAAKVTLWGQLTSEQAALQALTDKRQKHDLGQSGSIGRSIGIVDNNQSNSFDDVIATNNPDLIGTWIGKSSKKVVGDKQKALQGAVEWSKAHLAKNPNDAAAQQGLTDDEARLRIFNEQLAVTDPDSGGLTPNEMKDQAAVNAALKKRDSVGGLKAKLQQATTAVNQATNSGDRAKAIEAQIQAQQAYDDGVQKQTNAIADINANPASKLDTATRKLRDAKQELAKYTKGTLEWAEASAGVVAAQRAMTEAQTDLDFLKAQDTSDLTDKLAVDKNAIKHAQDKLRDAKAKQAAMAPGDQASMDDEIHQDSIDLKGLQATQEADALNRKLTDAKNLETLGKISHAQYMSTLQSQHDQLVTQLAGMDQNDNMYQQIKDQITQIELDMKAAGQAMSGQFNLGDIKVPTVYEVRRGLKNSLGGDAANVTVDRPVTGRPALYTGLSSETTTAVTSPTSASAVGQQMITRLEAQLAAMAKGTNGYWQASQDLAAAKRSVATPTTSEGAFSQIQVEFAAIAKQLAAGGGNSSVVNHFTFNGADLTKVEAIVKKAVAAGSRYTPAARKA